MPARSEPTVVVRPLSEALGAEILGVDLCDIGQHELAICHQALVDHCIVVIRDQRRLTPEAHIQFSRSFGELEVHVAEQFLLPAHPEILRVSNRPGPDGAEGFAEAGRYWHSDLSYMAAPAKCSLLHAIELPPTGGDTLFANMYRALDRLPADLRWRIDGLEAWHSYEASLQGRTAANSSRAKLSAEQLATVPAVLHPVVRVHPDTKRKVLFVNPGFTTHVDGMPAAESDALLSVLFEASTQPDNVYRHEWQLHDLVVWDNRCTLHHATVYDPNHTRHMHRTTVRGEAVVQH